MKKLAVILLLTLSLLALFSCTEDESGEGGTPTSFTMIAEVRSLGEKIEVDVVEAEYAFGIYLIITSDKTEFLDKDGNSISKEDIRVGDNLVISYNGQVMMSYPPQVAALSIKKK